MINFFKTLLKRVIYFFKEVPKYWYIIILLGVIFGIIFNVEVGFFVALGVIFLFIMYVWLRQMYWFFFKKGDYAEDDNDKEE